MNMNKKIFLIVTLVTLLIIINSSSAIDTNMTVSSEKTNDDGVLEINQNSFNTPDDEKLIKINSNNNNFEKTEPLNKNAKDTKTQLNLPVIPMDANAVANSGNQLTITNQRILLNGNFENMGNINVNINTGELIYYGTTPMKNTTFTVTGDDFGLTNIRIYNSGNDFEENAILIVNASNAVVNRSNIVYNKSLGEVHGINVYNSNNVSVVNTIVNITGKPQYMGWTNTYPWQGGVKVSGITYINSSNSKIIGSNITVQNNSSPYLESYSTMEGITIRDHSHFINATNNIINVTGGRNNYGTTVSDGSTNITFDDNTFNITGERYVCGLQYDNSKNCSALNNNISLLSEIGSTPLTTGEELISYGIILTAWSNGGTLNSTVSNNTVTSTSNIGYGLEIYDAIQSNITENNFTLDGIKVMGIGSYNGHNTNITGNMMHLSGTGGTTNNIYEMITPDNQGIFIDGATNNNVNESIICVHNSGDTITDIYAIKSTSTLNQLKNNQVCVCNSGGQKSLDDSISASATSPDANTLYTCPQCSGNCMSGATPSQTPSSSLSKGTKRSVKTEAQTIIITADNFYDYVTNKTLNDNVNEGDILDFQGIFYGTRFALDINKPVNIISSTNDAYICLDGVNTDFFGVKVGSSFTVSRNGSGTNISGIYFNNTQLFIKNAENITINNITVNNEDLQLGSGVGVTSIRENSSNVQVLNSHFRSKDNLGHSTLVCAWANNVLIENCTIEAEGMVGNLFYATTYNVEGIEAAEPYVNNNITFRNNHIDGLKADVAAICYAIAIEGKGHVIENNLIEYYGSGITNQWGYGNTSNITIRNNTIPYGTSRIGIFNGTIVEDNYINFTSLEDSIVKNNKFNTVEIYSNVTFTDNVVGKIVNEYHPDQIENVTISRNFIDTLILDAKSKNFYIANNTIYSSETYAVTIKKDTENITLENNLIASKDKNSTEAINATGNYTSINTTGMVVYNVTDDDILEYNWMTEHGKLYYEQSAYGSGYYFDGADNSVAYLNLNRGGTLTFANLPSIIIVNAPNVDYLQPQTGFGYGKFSFDRTALIKDSYLPNTYSDVWDGMGWTPINVDTLLYIVNSTMKDSSGVGTQSEIRYYNVSFVDDVINNNTDIITTNVSVDAPETVGVGDEVTINITVLTNNTTLDSGKVVVFDELAKYGEFDIVEGVACWTTSFNEVEQHNFIAYYIGENNYNSSNTKFNVSVKVLNAKIEVEPLTIEYGSTTTVTAIITTDDNKIINTGRVAFRVNGKVLRDGDNKVIYVDVTDGKAILEDFTVTSEQNGTIEAIYSSKIKYNVSSVKSNYTVVTSGANTPELILDNITTGRASTINFKVKVENVDDLNAGKVLVKINGKIVKDTNTNKLYVKVTDGVANFEYTLPKTLTSGNYTIRAVYTEGINELTAESTLTIE